MTDQLPAHYKTALIKATIPHYVAIAFMVSMLGAAALISISSLLGGDLSAALAFGFGFLFLAWLYTTPLVTNLLYIPMHNHLYDRDHGRVEAAFSRAIGILKRLPVYKGPYIPGLLSNLGVARLKQGHYESAESLFRDALQQAQMFHKHRGGKGWIPSLAVLHNNLAVSCVRQNNHVEAELIVERGIELVTKANNTRFESYLAPLYLVTGVIRSDLGELAEAEEPILKAIDFGQRPSKPWGMAPYSKTFDLQCNLQLALLYARRGDFAKADPICDHILGQHLAPFSTLSLRPLNSLAGEYLDQEAYSRSERLLEIAYAIARDCPFHPDSKKTLLCFEKHLKLTDRQGEIADMRSWLRPVTSDPIARIQ